jgi:ABC-type phosphate transport system substrate-binding protein
MKNSKGTVKKVGSEVKKRTFSNILGRLSFLRTTIGQRLAGFIPARYRWLVPFLQQELDLKAPTLDDLKDRLAKEAETEVEEGEIVEELLVSPVGLPLDSLVGDLPATLSPGREIQGIRRRYQVERYLGDRCNGRIYLGRDILTLNNIIVKEYPLDRYLFSPQEIKERKKRFKGFAGFTLADGKNQDFRVIKPLEAIADTKEERCYLIFDEIVDQTYTLFKFLQESSRMSQQDVYLFLDQVLQSLQFLHSQKFRFPNGMVTVGLSHGNLSLNSLFFVKTSYSFLIYLMDLSLWEELFNGSQKINTLFAKESSQKQDLKDLGEIAFALLMGNSELNTIDAKDENNWPDGVDFKLKGFIKNLIGIGDDFYDSAEIARQKLSKINVNSFSQIEEEEVSLEPEVEPKKKRNYRLIFIVLGVLGVFLLGILIWFFTNRGKQQEVIATDVFQSSLEEITGIPSGQFFYLTDENGVWRYVLTNKNLLATGKSLEEEVKIIKPDLYLRYVFSDIPVVKKLSFTPRDQEYPADFGVTTFINEFKTDFSYEKLEYQEFAYDGLVFFVAFSYANREKGLPNALDGSISLEDLRKLYTGKIKNWKEIGGSDFPVEKLYISVDDEMVEIFKSRVLQDPKSIQIFENLLKNKTADQPIEIIRLKNTTQTLQSIIGDFEQSQPIASIGFDSLSKVFGQCSVYPLAIADNKTKPISPLIETNSGQPITPKTDLCKKGSYTHNLEAFISRNYPLTYSLAVVYPRDNRQQPIGKKFAEILKSKEIQDLLQQTNLVPLQPLE